MMKDRIEIVQGDITTIAVDGIVNAANPQLAGGGGVDGAIHRAAGIRQLRDACRELGGCPTGEVRSTPAFSLPAKRVLHTVGPVWRGGDSQEAELLASCYITTLALAEKEGLSTVSFPAISCGVYGYPHQEAVEIALKETCEWLEGHELPKKVIFVLFDQPMAELYRTSFSQLLSP
ncbi:MAG: macro domain-containing protein [Endozoicomonas sp.]